jgi:hypothetical protein
MVREGEGAKAGQIRKEMSRFSLFYVLQNII